MDTNIADLVSDELRSVRKKINQVVELLRYFVRPESSSVYASLLKAGGALEAAEAEVSRLRRPAASDASQPAGATREVTYRISPEERIVYLTVSDGATFVEFRDALRSVLADPDYRLGFNFLSDRSRTTNLPAAFEVREAVDFFKQHADRMGPHQWAMVSGTDTLYCMQSMFAMLSESWGSRAKVFMDADAAKRWLLDEAA
jgi:hypothetical protein